jgi:hypothetical protein
MVDCSGPFPAMTRLPDTCAIVEAGKKPQAQRARPHARSPPVVMKREQKPSWDLEISAWR